MDGPNVDAAATAVAALLDALAVPAGEHTARTPARVAHAWADALSGYRVDPGRHLAVTFPAPDPAGLVIVAGVRVVSTCAHHMLPITGTATVAYRPTVGAPIVGLSKLARVVHDHAARLQVQEQLGHDVAGTVQARLRPVGACCIITAEHGCMMLRGVREPGAVTTTIATTGGWSLASPDVVAAREAHRDAR